MQIFTVSAAVCNDLNPASVTAVTLTDFPAPAV